MTAWLRRVFHRPPTIKDCMRAAARAGCEPLKAPERDKGVCVTWDIVRVMLVQPFECVHLCPPAGSAPRSSLSPGPLLRGGTPC